MKLVGYVMMIIIKNKSQSFLKQTEQHKVQPVITAGLVNAVRSTSLNLSAQRSWALPSISNKLLLLIDFFFWLISSACDIKSFKVKETKKYDHTYLFCIVVFHVLFNEAASRQGVFTIRRAH